MSWRKISQNLYLRFQVAVSGAIFLFCLLLFTSYSIYQQSILKDEIRSIIENEATNILSTHQDERKRRDYHTLQRYLQQIPHVDVAVLYDKDCVPLNTTFIGEFQTLDCGRIHKKLIPVTFKDVISPVGLLVVKPHYPSVRPWNIALGICASLSLGLFASWFVTLAWKNFVYRPLHSELTQLTKGESAQIQELGEIGSQIRSLIEKSKVSERVVERARYREEKAQVTLRIAHDILSPLRLLQNDRSLGTLSSSSLQAIQDIQAIALDLLPEKAGLVATRFSLTELVSDAVAQSSSHFETKLSPIIEVSHDIYLTTSRVHLLRAVSNIVKNALEVEPEHTQVIVRVLRSTEGMAVIEIQDHGPGFEASGTKLTGSGLGITSARDTLKTLKGELSYDSSPQGTIARITLPGADQRPIVLIEDDKYVCQKWRSEAQNAGIPLEVYNSSEFSVSPGAVVYYDRFVNNVDITPQIDALIAAGVEAYSISALDNPTGKTPPWLQ